MIAKPTLRVAVAQIDVAPLDLETNLEHHLEVVERARAERVDVLVFPELSLTGYLVGERGYEIGIELSDPPTDPVVGRLAAAAGEMIVVAGFVEEGHGAQFFNTAAALQHGRLLHVHRKLNLANYGDMEEAKFFASGRYIESFRLEHPFFGSILLCSDMWNPPLVHIAALHGATILLVPTNSSLDERTSDFSKPGRWEMVLQFYASLYGLPIAFCNRIGREGTHTFWGGSRILDAYGSELARAGEGEELLVAEVAYGDVRKARHALPTVRDSNLALIHREISRLADRVGVPEVVRPLRHG
jgi:N-carbamoylputrescine amidase